MPVNSTLTLDTPESRDQTITQQVQVTKVRAVRLDVRAFPGGERRLNITYGFFDASDNMIEAKSFSARGAEIPDNLLNDLITFVGKITTALQNRGDLPAGSIS